MIALNVWCVWIWNSEGENSNKKAHMNPEEPSRLSEICTALVKKFSKAPKTHWKSVGLWLPSHLGTFGIFTNRFKCGRDTGANNPVPSRRVSESLMTMCIIFQDENTHVMHGFGTHFQHLAPLGSMRQRFHHMMMRYLTSPRWASTQKQDPNLKEWLQHTSMGDIFRGTNDC